MGNLADFLPNIEGSAGIVPVTRFAPSPNGRLHIGHAYSALCAHDFIRKAGGDFTIRIEDIDATRSRVEYAEAACADLEWLGLKHDRPIVNQSSRIEDYRAVLDRLKAMGLVYPCQCSRSDINAAIKAKPVRHGPDGPVYPGTCKGSDIIGTDICWRLDMAAATERVGPLTWYDMAAGMQQADPARFGDIILWRKDAPASYHLAATHDDAADGMTHIVRGLDLFAYTDIHRLLQALLNLRVPQYWHHPLLLDEKGMKLAKSRFSEPLSQLRALGIEGSAVVASLRTGELPTGITRSNV